MKIQYKISKALLVCLALFLACNKKPTDYRSFLNGQERLYPGVATNTAARPGNKRLMLTWHPSADPSVTRYVVYWNNYADSVTVQAITHNAADTVKVLIPNLTEYTYTFFMNSYDDQGNKSITTTINNAHAYGPVYQTSLHNRLPDPATPFVVNNDGTVQLNFITPDTINIATIIKYTDGSGNAAQASLAAASKSVVLPSFQFGTTTTYQSTYIPQINAIDTFKTLGIDTFPRIFRLEQLDKSLFNAAPMGDDVGSLCCGADYTKLWDGSVGVQGFPNIFHSDGNHPLPHTLSFDMGQVYNDLAVMEEIGRDCCHNPDDFEVWGIADTTGAVPTVTSEDANWKSQMLAKGWTLLLNGTRGDDGSAPMKFNFINNPPPIRFIRMRIKHVASGSNESSNMSELTFWHKR